MKLRNKSGLIAAIAGLTAVSLLSVGFASWVISGSDEATIEDGAIHVETVTDNNLFIFESVPTDLDEIVFGKPDATTIAGISNPWLTAPEVPEESLDFEFDVSIKNLTSTNYSQVLTATISAVDPDPDDAYSYANAVSAGVVGALPTLAIAYKSGNTVTVSGSFAWGSHFDSDNPYVFYNTGHTALDEISTGVTYASDAKTSLEALYNNLSGVTYTITLTTHVPA